MVLKKEISNNILNRIEKLSFDFKVWFKFNNESILGDGWSKLLQTIKNNDGQSLLKAAESCNYSYKYAWSILKRIKERTGMPVVDIERGGPGGGGCVKLNEWGDVLLDFFIKFKNFTQKNLNNYFIELKNSK